MDCEVTVHGEIGREDAPSLRSYAWVSEERKNKILCVVVNEMNMMFGIDRAAARERQKQKRVYLDRESWWTLKVWIDAVQSRGKVVQIMKAISEIGKMVMMMVVMMAIRTCKIDDAVAA